VVAIRSGHGWSQALKSKVRFADFTGSSRNGDSTPIDLREASLKFGPSAKSSCFTKGRSKRILNTIALIGPFGTH
jgi:hypothetical protein